MQDLKLKSLVDEVNRCNTNFNMATTPEIISIASNELMAAEESLNTYLKERKSAKEKDSQGLQP